MDMFQFITNSEGKKKAVIVPIEQYNSLIESQKRLKELEEVDLSQKEKDPAKMSKEEFFAMIDKRRKSKSIKMSMEDMQDLLVIMQRKDEPKSPFSEALERIKKYREKNLNTESR
jgi:phd_YefM